jgi:hypothetical protein
MNVRRRITGAAIRVLALAWARRDWSAYYHRPPEATMRRDWKSPVESIQEQLEPWG